AEFPVADVAFGRPGTEGLLDRTLYTQTALFALQVGLFRLYESWGVRPAVVVGHSIGEVAAAHVAGVLSLEDAAVLISTRARLMEGLPSGGAMVAVQAGEEEVAGRLAGVGLAAVNAADSVVVAGDEAGVEEVAAYFRELGRKVKRLTVSHAFHSPLMEPVLDDFLVVARTLTYNEPQIPVVSTVGTELEWTDPEYWTAHIRSTVRFHQALEQLGEEYAELALVELGPGTTLTALARQTLPDHTAVSSLKKDQPQAVTALTAVGTLHAHGTPLDWQALTPGARTTVDLPTYPFQHQHYWLDPSEGLKPRPPAREDALFEVEWTAPKAPAAAASPSLVVPADLQEAVDMMADGQAVDVIVQPLAALFPDDPTDDRAAAAHSGLERTLAFVQEWLGRPELERTKLVVTCVGAVATDKGREEPVDPATASVWALLHSVQNEYPDRLVLVDHDGDPLSTSDVTAALATGEAQCAVRRGQVLVPRLVGVRKSTLTPAPWDPSGTVLVTGGTGALAGLFARHLVTEHGVTRLLLTSRSGLNAPGAQRLVDDLTALGAEVTVTPGDITDPGFVTELLDSVPPEHPLTGIVHTAGTRDDGLVTTLTPDRVSAVLRPKSDAAWHLHEQTARRGIQLDFFVLFSSIAAPFGGPGQASYAAANAFLDGLATHRHAQNLPATSLAWGLWDRTGGMADQLSEADIERVVRRGYVPISVERGLALFDAAIARPHPAFVATPVDREVLRTSGIAPALLRTLVADPSEDRSAATDKPAEDGGGRQQASLAERITGLTGNRRTKVVLGVVREETATVLGHGDPAAVPGDRPFKEMGFDSLTAVELRNRLGRAAGLTLPPTVVFDHPTPAALADHLLAELAPEELSVADLVAAEIARLEKVLDDLDDGEDNRREIRAQLSRVLGKWDDPDTSGAGADGLDLDDASDDDLFKLVAANRRD
ncbi:MAG TPA: KR domain-containing protein, partial [Streptomyces sp.]